MNVLLVEDDRQVGEFIASELQAVGHARTEVLDEHVGILDQPVERAARPRGPPQLVLRAFRAHLEGGLEPLQHGVDFLFRHLVGALPDQIFIQDLADSIRQLPDQKHKASAAYQKAFLVCLVATLFCLLLALILKGRLAPNMGHGKKQNH